MHRLDITSGSLKGQSFDLKESPFFIGRSSKNHIQIKDIAVSRQQLKIFKIGEKLYVEDLESTNGTLLNGERITPRKKYNVGEGDTIAIANTIMHVNGGSPKESSSKEPDNKTEGKLSNERRSQSQKDLKLVFKVTELLRQSSNMDEIIDKVLGYLLDALPRIDRVAILLFENKQREIKRVISRSRQDPEELDFIYSRSVVNKVIQDGRPVMMADTCREAPNNFKTGMGTLQIGSIMCVPMISDSKMLGVIYVDSIHGPYSFRKDDLLLLESLSGPIVVAIEKAMLANRLEGSLSEIRIIR
jgi:pSer/pThr/pTyr-binding forkhead associated (FHA) protein